MHRTDPRIVLGLYRARPTHQLLETALELGIRHIDTAPGYHHGQGHRDLARAAVGLLSEFTVSTKVGFFPDGHSLDPARLRVGIQGLCSSLGQPPGVLLLHNPETSLERLNSLHAHDALIKACAVLADAVNTGLCGGWGIATWNPRPVVGAATAVGRPDILMVRAGLTVNGSTLHAIEKLARRLRPHAVWGMAPFGGNAADPVWEEIEPRQFLRPGSGGTTVQAVFRAAYALPNVERIAVGAGDPAHLRALADASRLEIDTDIVARYRELLRSRN